MSDMSEMSELWRGLLSRDLLLARADEGGRDVGHVGDVGALARVTKFETYC